MGMAHFSSGKNGFEYWTFNSSKVGIPFEKLEEILKLEDKYRASKEYQDKYSEKDDLQWYEDVTLGLQRRVLIETGLFEHGMDEEWDDEAKASKPMSPEALGKKNEKMMKNALQALWATRGNYQGRPELMKLSVYAREDRSRMGTLTSAMPMPDAKLSDRNGALTTIKQYYTSLQKDSYSEEKENGRYMFIIAGSVT